VVTRNRTNGDVIRERLRKLIQREESIVLMDPGSCRALIWMEKQPASAVGLAGHRLEGRVVNQEDRNENR